MVGEDREERDFQSRPRMPAMLAAVELSRFRDAVAKPP